MDKRDRDIVISFALMLVIIVLIGYMLGRGIVDLDKRVEVIENKYRCKVCGK